MKSKLKYLLILISLAIIPTVESQTTQCSMKNMKSKSFNLETQLSYDLFTPLGGGLSSKDDGLIITSNGQEGAIWFKKEVILGPRFEIRLKVHIGKEGCNDPESNRIDGFAIILSKQDNYLGVQRVPGGLGYHNIYNAVISEVDLNQDETNSDISANSMSIHNCQLKSCSTEENINTKQNSLWNVNKLIYRIITINALT